MEYPELQVDATVAEVQVAVPTGQAVHTFGAVPAKKYPAAQVVEVVALLHKLDPAPHEAQAPLANQYPALHPLA